MGNFDEWNKQKKLINRAESSFFHEGEIWWISLGKNVGIEQNGRGDTFLRPVLVLQKYNNKQCFIIPLTTQKSLERYSFYLKNVSFLKKASWIVFSQGRVIDGKRLHEKMGKLSPGVFREIQKEAVKKILPSASL